LWAEAASGLRSLDNRGAELGGPEGHLNHFGGYKASGSIVGCSLISEDGFKISHLPMLSLPSVETELHHQPNQMMRRTLSRDEIGIEQSMNTFNWKWVALVPPIFHFNTGLEHIHFEAAMV
jgi:hypothetical protein